MSYLSLDNRRKTTQTHEEIRVMVFNTTFNNNTNSWYYGIFEKKI
jgi:hypothetical protein